jgi:hypothetical protein
MLRPAPAVLSRKAREEIRYQHATHRLQRHRDDLIDASEAVGVGGVVLGVVCVLWMLTRCGPTLLPGLFG